MTLRLDWCSHKAAKYAVEHWHYSKQLPVSKKASVGVWENGRFIGAVIFSWGANPNLAGAYRLQMNECIELVRVALTTHHAPVSKIIAIALRLLARKFPSIRLVVSFADRNQGHLGTIYQAGNWIYAGETAPKWDYMYRGRILQRRAYTGRNFGRGAAASSHWCRKSQKTIKTPVPLSTGQGDAQTD